MGDLRILRNVILHAKGIIRAEKHKELKKIDDMFTIDKPIHISYMNMHRIFVFIKQDCAKLLYELWGIKNAPIRFDEIQDIAIQRGKRGDLK